jgi:hypothetical protein
VPNIKDEVLEILTGKGGKTSKHERVSMKVKSHLLPHGAFIAADDGELYYRSESAGRLYTLDSNDMLDVLQEDYGLNASEGAFRYVVSTLATQARRHGTKARVHRLGHWDAATERLYLTNYKGRMWVIDGGQVPHAVDNGADGVLLHDHLDWEPYRVVKYTKGDLWKHLVADVNFVDQPGGLTVDDQRCLLMVYIFTLPYGSFLATRAIALVTGPQGSGKTEVLRSVLKLLFGATADVAGVNANQERDLIAAIANNPLLYLDNVDEFSRNVADWLCRAATGAVITQRKLFTTRGILKTKPVCWVGITTRNNPHRRSDLIDRALLFTLGRRESFANPSEMHAKLLAARDALWTEYIALQQQVVAALRAGKRASSSTSRLGDWATLAEVAGGVLFPEWNFQRALARLEVAHVDHVVEDDPVVTALDLFLWDRFERAVFNRQPVEATFTSSHLNTQLEKIASAKMGLKCWPHNPRTLGMKLNDLVPALSGSYRITVKKRGHSNLWTFARRDHDGAAQHTTSHDPSAEDVGVDVFSLLEWDEEKGEHVGPMWLLAKLGLQDQPSGPSSQNQGANESTAVIPPKSDKEEEPEWIADGPLGIDLTEFINDNGDVVVTTEEEEKE